jgi:hypothetical protein
MRRCGKERIRMEPLRRVLLEIPLDEELAQALRDLAERVGVSLEALIAEVLRLFAREVKRWPPGEDGS